MSTDFSAQRARFGRMERRGVFLGLTWLQIIVLAGVALTAVILLVAQAYLVLIIAALPLLLIAVLGAGRWRREPLLNHLLAIAGYGRRVATGQSVALGGPDATGAAARVGRLNLAGGIGSIDLHQVEGGGAFTYDSRRGRATFTVSCTSPAWALTDAPDQHDAVAGFTRFLNGLTRIPGLVSIDIQCRADASASTDLEDYVEAQISARESAAFMPVSCPKCGVVGTTRFCVSCGHALRQNHSSPLGWVDDQARLATAEVSSTSKEFSYFITVALETRGLTRNTLQQLVRRGGGGLRGLSQVLSLAVGSLSRSLSKAGVTEVTWLDSDDYTALLRLAYDPETTIAQTRAHGRRRRQSPDVVRPMAQEEKWDHLRVDESFHQVFWITEWPTSDVPYGFLEELIANGGDFTRVVTLQIIPNSKEKALKRVQQARVDLESAQNIRDKIGQQTTREQSAEEEDIQEREEDLAEGYRDMEFRGFVTVTAGSREQLDEARNEVEVTAQESQIEVRPMYFQQAAAFNTAVLPLGLGRVAK